MSPPRRPRLTLPRKAALVLLAIAPLAALSCRRPAPPVEARPEAAVPLPDAALARTTPPDAREEIAPDVRWVEGKSSRARAWTKEWPRHDQSVGVSIIEIERRAPEGSPRRQRIERAGVWRILAYVEDAPGYLLGGHTFVGAWTPLGLLEHLLEDGQRRPLRFGDSRMMAMAGVAGPRGRYLALVASPESADPSFALYAYDVTTEALVRLGRAPAPPPAEAGECAALDRHARWDWGDPIDGFVDLDPGILTFKTESTLEVTYGADKCQARAKRRQTKTWDLATLLARAKR